MKEFVTFDKKSKKLKEVVNFKKEIFNNEIVWTYLVGEIAKVEPKIYEKITTFKSTNNHSIYFEGQPKSPYVNIEGNSYIDMALGALEIREDTTSGLSFSKNNGNEVCFVESKYLSDLSNKTKHSPVRNQMERVIENLLILKDDSKYPEKIVFTLITPRIFKKELGSRMYSYKFQEYKDKLGEDNNFLAKKIELTEDNSKKRFDYSKTEDYIKNRLGSLNINWVTFEDIFEKFEPQLSNMDITNENDAIETWDMIRKKLIK